MWKDLNKTVNKMNKLNSNSNTTSSSSLVKLYYPQLNNKIFLNDSSKYSLIKLYTYTHP